MSLALVITNSYQTTPSTKFTLDHILHQVSIRALFRITPVAVPSHIAASWFQPPRCILETFLTLVTSHDRIFSQTASVHLQQHMDNIAGTHEGAHLERVNLHTSTYRGYLSTSSSWLQNIGLNLGLEISYSSSSLGRPGRRTPESERRLAGHDIRRRPRCSVQIAVGSNFVERLKQVTIQPA